MDNLQEYSSIQTMGHLIHCSSTISNSFYDEVLLGNKYVC